MKTLSPTRTIEMTGLALLLILSAACSSGGGNGGGGIIKSGLGANFAADASNPGSLTVAMAEQLAVGDVVTVDVNVNGVNDIFGANLTLTFDPALAEFLGHSPGTLLESGGSAATYLVTSTLGQLDIGASRVGGSSGVNATSPTPLVRVTFRVLEAGNSSLAFGNGDLLDAQPPAPQSIPGLTWFGGTLIGTD